MLLPNRHGSSDKYRYGFNGMEKDDELKGEGNSYTTHFRQFDPRIGRWLSLDPVMEKYSYQSPYVAFNNNPILYADPKGDDPPSISKIIRYGSRKSNTFAKLVKANDIEIKTAETVIRYTKTGSTATGSISGNIKLRESEDLDHLVVSLAHELSNRTLGKEFREADYNLVTGKISPEEYAKITLKIELKALQNQIVVAGEIGLEYGNGSTFDKLGKQFLDGEITEDQFKKELQKIANNGKLTNEDGESILKQYEKEGFSFKQSYIKRKQFLRLKNLKRFKEEGLEGEELAKAANEATEKEFEEFVNDNLKIEEKDEE